MRSSRMLWVTCALLCAGCASRSSEADAPPRVQPGPAGTVLVYEGPVVVSGVVGSTFTTLSVPGRGAIGVVGVLEPEVRRLAGARVRVQGPAGAGFPGEAVDVRSYLLLEVNGERPYVGVLTRSGQALALEQSPTERIVVSVGPLGLEDNVGAKVWLTGTMSAGSLQVQSFGVIRPR